MTEKLSGKDHRAISLKRLALQQSQNEKIIRGREYREHRKHLNDERRMAQADVLKQQLIDASDKIVDLENENNVLRNYAAGLAGTLEETEKALELIRTNPDLMSPKEKREFQQSIKQTSETGTLAELEELVKKYGERKTDVGQPTMENVLRKIRGFDDTSGIDPAIKKTIIDKLLKPEKGATADSVKERLRFLIGNANTVSIEGLHDYVDGLKRNEVNTLGSRSTDYYQQITTEGIFKRISLTLAENIKLSNNRDGEIDKFLSTITDDAGLRDGFKKLLHNVPELKIFYDIDRDKVLHNFKP